MSRNNVRIDLLIWIYLQQISEKPLVGRGGHSSPPEYMGWRPIFDWLDDFQKPTGGCQKRIQELRPNIERNRCIMRPVEHRSLSKVSSVHLRNSCLGLTYEVSIAW